MAIYLTIPYNFYTDLNFQRPTSCLILIWDPVKFYYIQNTTLLGMVISSSGELMQSLFGVLFVIVELNL